jgi:hypothetical protein
MVLFLAVWSSIRSLVHNEGPIDVWVDGAVRVIATSNVAQATLP